MLRLFQAGMIAALMQGLAILLATLLVFSYGHHGIENLKVPADDPTVQLLIPLLQLIYLLTALGVALTRHRFVDLTADRIRRASRLMNCSDPDRAANTLMVSLWFHGHGIWRGNSQFASFFSDGAGLASRKFRRRTNHMVRNDEHRSGQLRCQCSSSRAQAVGAPVRG
jgi:hypothetical protein